MKTKQASSLNWYNRIGGALAIVVGSLALTYVVALRAIDTGSLQQYFIVFTLLILAGNRVYAIFDHRRTRQGSRHENA